MKSPRSPAGAGITGALATLGGGISRGLVSGPGSSFNDRAAVLGRQADLLLSVAERLAFRADGAARGDAMTDLVLSHPSAFFAVPWPIGGSV
jgi:hypothetical protein